MAAKTKGKYNVLSEFIADKNVQCGNCQRYQIGSTQAHTLSGPYAIRWFECLHCKVTNLEIAVQRIKDLQIGIERWVDTLVRHPSNQRRFQMPENCPQAVTRDFHEAEQLLEISPMASGGFARRCLQTLLREQGYNQSRLVDQITALLTEKNPAKIVPHYITASIDAIRNFGNFAAHGTMDTNAATLIEVEPGEAEWCLRILEDLIEHYYVRPQQEQAKVDAINLKLQAAGRPPIKRPPS